MGLLESIDFHVHTSRSVCCQREQTLERLLQSYKAKGIKHVAICDHYYPGKIELFRQARQEIDDLAEKLDLDVRLSAEIEIDDHGVLDCEEFDVLLPLLDHVSAAPHTKTLKKTLPEGADPVKHLHRAHMAATKNPMIDVILHPWDGAEAVVESLEVVDNAIFAEFAEACAAHGKVVEVSNCINHYWIRPSTFTKSYDILVKELVRAKVRIVVGSDGHNMEPVPEMWHLSVAATTGDTSWASASVRRVGGDDSWVNLPLSRRR